MYSFKNFIVMKKVIILWIIAIAGIVSCKDQYDISRKYEIPGGVAYPAKADSAVVLSGYKQVVIQWLAGADPSVVSARISWNSNTGDTLISIPPEADTIRCRIPLEEGLYVFEIRTFDAKGNISVPVEISGRSVGDNFISGLNNRSMESVYYADEDGTVTITWGNAPNYAVGCQLSYTATDNSTKSVMAPVSENVTVISDWKSGLSYYTLFSPGEGADIISISAKSVAILKKCDKTGWEIPAKSGDNNWFGNGPVEGIIDGDYDDNKFWHVGAGEGLPHWAVIDMKVPREVTRIITKRRPGGDTRRLQYYVSDNPDPADMSTWVLLVDGAYASTSADNFLTLDAEASVTGQYLLLVLPNSFREPYAAICEIDVYEMVH
jgi:hypothetical protein